jgi:predicted anti-sigma-YlaC factor YlaD
MVVTICLTILITPYSYLYDLVGYSVAMAVMFMRVTDWRRAVFGLLWVFSGYCGTLAVHTGHITLPAAAALAAALTWREMRGANAGKITAPHVMIRT